MFVFDHIIDNIYLGDRSAVSEDTIDVIINLSGYHDRGRIISGKTYYELPIDDSTSWDLSETFVKFDLILKRINPTQRILIYCSAGISRSPTVVLYYLMKYTGLTLRESYLYLKSKRKSQYTSPNFGFFKQLLVQEKKIHGRSSLVIEDYFRKIMYT